LGAAAGPLRGPIRWGDRLDGFPVEEFAVQVLIVIGPDVIVETLVGIKR
jgi:hypothetical protein